MKKLLGAIIDKFYPDSWVSRADFDQVQLRIATLERDKASITRDYLDLNKLLPKAGDKRGTLTVGFKMEQRADFMTSYSLSVSDDQIRFVPKKIQAVVIDQLARVLVENVKRDLIEKLVEAEA